MSHTRLAGEHNLTKAQRKALVDGLFKAIAEAAAAGKLPTFGKFKVKATPERESRHPSTIKIGAAKKLTFAPAKALKDSLNS